MVILLIEKVIDNKMFPKSTAGLYISDSYQRNSISHRHRIFYGLNLPFFDTPKHNLLIFIFHFWNMAGAKKQFFAV